MNHRDEEKGSLLAIVEQGYIPETTVDDVNDTAMSFEYSLRPGTPI